MRLARLFASLATLVSVGFGNAMALSRAVTRIVSRRFTSLLMRVTFLVETLTAFFSFFMAKSGIATITRTVSSAAVAFRVIKPPPVELVEVRATFRPAFRRAFGVDETRPAPHCSACHSLRRARRAEDDEGVRRVRRADTRVLPL